MHKHNFDAVGIMLSDAEIFSTTCRTAHGDFFPIFPESVEAKMAGRLRNGGIYPPRDLPAIIGGLLTFESDWKNPPLGKAMTDALAIGDDAARLDLGCVAAHDVWLRFRRVLGHHACRQACDRIFF